VTRYQLTIDIVPLRVFRVVHMEAVAIIRGSVFVDLNYLYYSPYLPAKVLLLNGPQYEITHGREGKGKLKTNITTESSLFRWSTTVSSNWTNEPLLGHSEL
jgi:hypothetical protein